MTQFQQFTTPLMGSIQFLNSSELSSKFIRFLLFNTLIKLNLVRKCPIFFTAKQSNLYNLLILSPINSNIFLNKFSSVSIFIIHNLSYFVYLTSTISSISHIITCFNTVIILCIFWVQKYYVSDGMYLRICLVVPDGVVLITFCLIVWLFIIIDIFVYKHVYFWIFLWRFKLIINER